jgi:pyridoxine 5-phosphate synthase
MSSASHLRLGVNIDHVATIRNARGGLHPDPVRAAHMAQKAGADGITAHLREDRRHITDKDIQALSEGLDIPLNLEMAATQEMQAIALRHKPHAVCLVPEKREERTTEGGLDVVENAAYLANYITPLREYSRISLFVAPDTTQIKAAFDIGAAVVELHTGQYCEATDADTRAQELLRLQQAAAYAHSIGLEVHAGHGLTFDTVADVAAIPEVVELNIGHFLMGEAIFTGLENAIQTMRRFMNDARA